MCGSRFSLCHRWGACHFSLGHFLFHVLICPVRRPFESDQHSVRGMVHYQMPFICLLVFHSCFFLTALFAVGCYFACQIRARKVRNYRWYGRCSSESFLHNFCFLLFSPLRSEFCPLTGSILLAAMPISRSVFLFLPWHMPFLDQFVVLLILFDQRYMSSLFYGLILPTA